MKLPSTSPAALMDWFIPIVPGTLKSEKATYLYYNMPWGISYTKPWGDNYTKEWKINE